MTSALVVLGFCCMYSAIFSRASVRATRSFSFWSSVRFRSLAKRFNSVATCSRSSLLRFMAFLLDRLVNLQFLVDRKTQPERVLGLGFTQIKESRLFGA